MSASLALHQFDLPLRMSAGRITEATDTAGTTTVFVDARPLARVRQGEDGRYTCTNLRAGCTRGNLVEYEVLEMARRIARIVIA